MLVGVKIGSPQQAYLISFVGGEGLYCLTLRAFASDTVTVTFFDGQLILCTLSVRYIPRQLNRQLAFKFPKKPTL